MISVVVPVFNEAESLRPLHAEIQGMAQKHGLEFEVIYVDDGSSDASWAVIAELARFPDVRGIRLRRNFGKAAALSAGFKAARGDVILTLDGDLQDDPAEIPRFLAELDKGLDVVNGWKQVRHDPWHKVWPSRVFNRLVSRLTGVRLHDHNCGMKAYRPAVIKEIRLYGELHRFIPVLAHARGFKVGELAIRHRPRRYGRSKYGVRRFTKGFLDLLTVKFLTGFGGRPSHLLGTIGLVLSLAGLAGLAYLAVIWLLRLWRPEDFDPIHTRPLMTYSAAALILGAQLLSMGFLAELIVARRSGEEDGYSIAETVNNQEGAKADDVGARL
jgi:glycosyltransferase involved in cell wall biosynthesis